MPGAYARPRYIGQIKVLTDLKFSNVQISEKVGKSCGTVDRIVKKLEFDNNAAPKEKSG